MSEQLQQQQQQEQEQRRQRHSEYGKNYYRKHRKEILDSRKKRYWGDENFRLARRDYMKQYSRNNQYSRLWRARKRAAKLISGKNKIT